MKPRIRRIRRIIRIFKENPVNPVKEKSKLCLAIILTIAQLYPVYAMQEEYVPISHYTDFNIFNKSATWINIQVKTKGELIQSSSLTYKLADEFNSSKRPYIYQSKLIAIPEDGNVEINIKNIDSILIPVNEDIIITTNDDSAPIIFLGKSGILKDIKVVPLSVKQFYYNKSSKSIVCYKNINVEVQFDTPLSLVTPNLAISKEWSSLYQSTILNYDGDNFIQTNTGFAQGYLIIVADALYNAILPLATWKNLKGYTVTVKKTSEIGSDTAGIRNYIRQTYLSSNLEYVLLVGSFNLIDCFKIHGTPSYGDHEYSCVSGNDLYPDLFVGRLPAANLSELALMVAKILGYEKAPNVSDTLWFRRALSVATQYQTSGGPVWTALATGRWVQNILLQNGYLRVDTVFDPPNANGVGIIDTIVNNGVTFINGRGWGNYDGWDRPRFKRADVHNLNNGWKLPIVTSFYCATGNYGAYPTRCFGEVWLLAGSPTNPKGAVAFYGPTYATTSTRFNNCQAYSVYWGIFREGLTNLGPAMFRGKLELFNNFPVPQDSDYLRWHVCSYNILGDPSLQMWTGVVPKPLVVHYPSEIQVGSSSFTVTVRNSSLQPVPGALISLYKTNEVKTVAFTDNNGNATLNFNTRSQDTLFITVTKDNYIPLLGNARVITEPVYVGYLSHTGNTIAGETANLSITLKNYGSSQTANNTFATLRAQDNQISIIDSLKSYGNLFPGQTTSGGPFQFAVAPNCTNNHLINFQLAINSETNNWHAGFSMSVRAAELSYKKHIINDAGNGILEPGEQANLIVKISNRGLENINNVSSILRSTNPQAIRVLDSIGTFGNVLAGDSAQNNTDYFTIQASSNIGIGRKFYFQIVLRSGRYERTIEFPITIGNVTSTSTLGPDAYGYWAYDNTDIAYTECPSYSWNEIDPNFGGAGTRIILRNDGIKTINLPFNFRYYGRNYSKLSICANGYIAMDSTFITDPYNWSIPSPLGPPALIAPFWDDFYSDTLNASGIYYYNDVSNHRFIVEWSRIYHIHGFRGGVTLAELQTFQVLLYNPAYYPSRTGDGPIVFQYNVVANDDSVHDDCHNYATVGIENYEQTTGIEYTFANQYPQAAAEIVNARAIKFTTNLPDSFTAITEPNHDIRNQIYSLKVSASPNPTKSLTTINYSIPIEGNVSVMVYNVSGNVIKTVVNAYKTPGFYRIQLLRKDIPAGVYFVKLTVKNNNDSKTQNTKIILY